MKSKNIQNHTKTLVKENEPNIIHEFGRIGEQ